MSLRMVLSPAARREMDEAADWYGSKDPDLESAFAAEVTEAFERILRMPELHPCVRGRTRKAVVTRFPYVVYYRLLRDHVVVDAVFHTSRNPAIWQKR